METSQDTEKIAKQIELQLTKRVQQAIIEETDMTRAT
jgi:hypothetical protein